MNKPTDYIASLAKGLRVLECFGMETARLSVTDVADLTGLDRASARRCLLTLHTEGYVNYDGKFFEPTTRVLRLGTGALAALPMPRIVQPWLDQLSERLGESVSVSVLDGTEIVYLARAAQHRIMSIGLMPGSRLPAHCTAMGRVLLASLATAEAITLLEQSDFSPRTVNSKTSVDQIMTELDEVRRLGFAVVDQETEVGLRSIAVPLIDSRGRTVAALNSGVAAIQPDALDLVESLLPELLRTQSGLKMLL